MLCFASIDLGSAQVYMLHSKTFGCLREERWQPTAWATKMVSDPLSLLLRKTSLITGRLTLDLSSEARGHPETLQLQPVEDDQPIYRQTSSLPSNNATLPPIFSLCSGILAFQFQFALLNLLI